jgi:hypothetical protein
MRSILTAAAILAAATPAFAHSWYSQKRDPIYNATTCCGGSDCAPLPAHAMSITPEGDLRVQLTLEEARKINPARRMAFDEVIPHERIQMSEDGTPHICLMATDRREVGDPRQGFFCIFLPPTG